MMKKLLMIVSFPLMLMHVGFYMLNNNKKRINEDLWRWNKVMHLGFRTSIFVFVTYSCFTRNSVLCIITALANLNTFLILS